MKKEKIAMICLLIIGWELAAVYISNDILVPYPLEVLKYTSSLFVDSTFYISILNTVLRVFKGFLLSMLLALIPAILSDYRDSFRFFFQPLQTILKTIPNVSYMIIALIWLGAEGAVTAVTFMILFPIFFNNFMNCLDLQSNNIKDIEKVYPESFWQKTIIKTVPLLLNEILYTGKTCASLGLKVGVMAEILGQVKVGIGKQLYLSKMNLDTTKLFAWTIVIILLSLCFDKLFDMLIFYKKKEEQQCKN